MDVASTHPTSIGRKVAAMVQKNFTSDGEPVWASEEGQAAMEGEGEGGGEGEGDDEPVDDE
jgi:hypothetical protein